MQRQKGNLDQQKQFRDLLYCLRDGQSTISDWELLMTRIPENIPKSERGKFSDAINILTTWKEVDRINLNKLRSIN